MPSYRHPPTAPQALAPLDLQVRTLPNGLRIACARLPGFRTAAIGAYLRVGSRDESASLNGLAHFAEHMAFKGTSRRDAHGISMAIEHVGGTINAYTAKDHTAYQTVLLAEHAGVALDVLSDVLAHSVYPAEEIEREREVILQELADAADDPESVAQDAFDALAYPRQALGRPILGTTRFVRRVTRADFLAHQAAHCTAANIVVAGVGGLEHEAFFEQVAQHFGDLPAGEPLARENASYVGGHRHVDDDIEQTSVVLGWRIPSRNDPRFPVFELLGELLGGGMSSPLFQAVRERRGLAYQVDAWTEGLEDDGILQVSAGVAPRNLRALLDVTCDELARAATDIGDADVERSRNQQATQLARSLERPTALAEWIARDLLMHGRVVSPEERLRVTLSIDAPALQSAAREMLGTPPTLALVGRAGRGDHYARVRRALAG